MPSLRSFMARRGQVFKVERKGICVAECEGILSCDGKGKKYCGFSLNAAVRTGDWLIDTAGNRYHVENADIAMVRQKPFLLKAYIAPEHNQNKNHKRSVPDMSGTTQATRPPSTASFDDCLLTIRERIIGSESADKEELLQMVTLIETVLKGHVSLHRGVLSRFSATIERNPWVSEPIMTSLLYWLRSSERLRAPIITLMGISAIPLISFLIHT